MKETHWDKVTSPGKTFIIAEAGVNHNGCFDTAIELIDQAKLIGADAIKFQSFNASSVCTASTEKSTYQLDTTDKAETFLEMIERLELSEKDTFRLQKYASDKDILFLSTPCDLESVNLLERVGVPFYKIASGDITNFPLLRSVASTHKPIIVSTGRSTMEEISDCIELIKSSGSDKIALLHCVSNYPAAFEDLNLNAMVSLRDQYNLPVGYSDHSVGIEASIAAVALKANIIEKHLTLNKNDVGPDHKASMEPTEFKSLVDAIRNIEKALGDGIKKPADSEMWGRENVRKGLISQQKINKGDIIQKEFIAVKRPGTGIHPKYFDDILGKIAAVNIEKDAPIQWEMLNGNNVPK